MRYPLIPLSCLMLFLMTGGPANAAYSYRQAVPGLAPAVAAPPAAPGVVNFGAYRAWDDGTFAATCSGYLNPPQGKAYTGDTGSGVYRLNINGAPLDAYCDMTTDGGGWMLVLNYLHRATTNPTLSSRSTLPVLGSTSLGTDESGSASTWGHASPALLSTLPGDTLRFTCSTNSHAGLVDFKVANTSALNYFKTGTGSIELVSFRAAAVALPGHTGVIPAAAGSGFGNQGASAMTEFPLYKNGANHWGIRGSGSRWECDDFAGNANYNTHHRIWLR